VSAVPGKFEHQLERVKITAKLSPRNKEGSPTEHRPEL
jgi:hypothetical protein